MIEITGKYNTANCYVDTIDQATLSQVHSFLGNPVFGNGRIALMPDCHKGSGSCIGFTMPVQDKIIPNVVGVDQGCGMLSINLGKQEDIDFTSLDDHIRTVVPLGFSIRQNSYDDMRSAKLFHTYIGNNYMAWERQVKNIIDSTGMDTNRALKSLGSLGGGNHFIELNKNTDDGTILLTIHSGSRNFGLQVAKYHQNKAVINCSIRPDKKDKVAELKTQYTGKELGDKIKELSTEYQPIPKDQSYLTGEAKENYLFDLSVAQKYASLNRYIMASEIIGFFDLDIIKVECTESIHNWIADDGIIRKGAIQANEGQRVVIPLNMRDGVIIGTGKGNPDYNNSAPHGAGRVLSRSKAKELLNIKEFKSEMKDVFSTSVSESTLDESPMAYKDSDMIKEFLKPTVDIIGQYKPIYNLKA